MVRELKKVGSKLRKKNREYAKTHPMAAHPSGEQACICCGRTFGLEKHHPYGRSGMNLFKWVWICGRTLHAMIHDQKAIARQLGWLQPEYFGHIADPAVPRPWLEPDEESNKVCDSE